ncbi:MAG: zeta toxin family protein [Candidatus Binatia bacterium]
MLKMIRGQRKRVSSRGNPSCSQSRPRFSWAVYAAILALLALSFSNAVTGDAPGFYPGKLAIPKAKTLTPQEREVEARFAKHLEERTDEAIARYQAKYGKEINTDNARELSQDYAPGGMDAEDSRTRAARAKWSSAVHEPSSALTKEIYRRELKKAAAPNERSQVVFTAGGAGSGKTTSIQQIAGLEHAVKAAQIIYDTTLSSLRSSLDRIAQALEAGKTVSIIFVYRDPIDSLVGGALPRAERNGRTLPLEVFLDTHLGAPEVLLKVAETYKNDKRVEIAIIDNSRGRGKAAAADLAFVQAVARKYTREDLRARLLRGLEDAYEKKKRGEKEGISEDIYRAFKGSAS